MARAPGGDGRLARDLPVGAAAGYAGSRAMDLATTWTWDRTGDVARKREHEANPDGTPLTVGRAFAARLGRDPGDATAYATAARAHRGLGLGYGVVAALLVRRGVRPLTAGLLSGAGAFVLVDEAVMSTVLPPPTAYPLQSHLRGVVGHLALGATAGAVLAAARRLS
ncbi:MAG: hypothetical protein JWN08_774 [Frankiales bacterium]|nr:hypothetical protein [Frankiales bacterium]